MPPLSARGGSTNPALRLRLLYDPRVSFPRRWGVWRDLVRPALPALLAAGAAFALVLPARAQVVAACGDPAFPEIDGCPGQPGRIDVQLFQPLPGGGTTFTVDNATVHRHMSLVLGAAASHAFPPLVSDRDGATTEGVSGLTQIDLMAALGLFEVMEVGLAVPIVSARAADDPNIDPATYTYSRFTGLGDVRLTLKVPLVRGDFALAARSTISLPTASATTSGNVNFTGARGWTASPGVVATYTAGKLTLAGDLAWVLRRRAVLGFEQRGLEQDDELALALGGNYAITDSISALVETRLHLGVGGRTGLGGDSLPANETPMDVNGGVRWRVADSVVLEAGVGTGLVAGVGAPPFRFFLAARYETAREQCPAGPEDYDGFQDDDYCADPDNDQDTILDDGDECPNDREDRDRYRDDDGCPDPDNDADGVLDARDRCPSESEDRDGFQDDDGCPEPDNDQDGVPDALDGANGECANDPENRNGFQDEDGCPDSQTVTINVTDTRILVSERIYFDFDRDTIRSVSMPLLNQVAAVIRDIPANRRIRVEGYTDEAGNPRYNVDLSYRRARAVVEYLTAHGVAAGRLDYQGFGSARPVAPNDSPEGQALNRRVEFIILDPQGPAPRPPTPPRPPRH